MSLRPHSVRLGNHEYNGVVGDQVVRLFKSTKDGNGASRPMLVVLDGEAARLFYGVGNKNRVPRVIAYQENTAGVEAQLRLWQRQFSKQ